MSYTSDDFVNATIAMLGARGYRMNIGIPEDFQDVGDSEQGTCFYWFTWHSNNGRGETIEGGSVESPLIAWSLAMTHWLNFSDVTLGEDGIPIEPTRPNLP